MSDMIDILNSWNSWLDAYPVCDKGAFSCVTRLMYRMCDSVLHGAAVCCSVLQSATKRCSVLQSVAERLCDTTNVPNVWEDLHTCMIHILNMWPMSQVTHLVYESPNMSHLTYLVYESCCMTLILNVWPYSYMTQILNVWVDSFCVCDEVHSHVCEMTHEC